MIVIAFGELARDGYEILETIATNPLRNVFGLQRFEDLEVFEQEIAEAICFANSREVDVEVEAEAASGSDEGG